MKPELTDLTVRVFSMFPERTTEGGYVYFWFCDGPDPLIKIGRAQDLAKRLSHSQVGCPYDLHPSAWFYSADPIADEAVMHAHFDYSRVRGEWFRLDEDLLTVIVECRKFMRKTNKRVADALLGRDNTWTWRGRERPL